MLDSTYQTILGHLILKSEKADLLMALEKIMNIELYGLALSVLFGIEIASQSRCPLFLAT